MKKRVCETCRFFQEAGFAKNGWCNHPQRKESSDVRIVVRRNDLPCRNGWAQDLWTPSAEGSDNTDVVLHDTVVVRPEQPASVEELTFLVNSQREKPTAPDVPPPGVMPVDVVVGEAPSTKPAKERQSLLELDPRAAILKAREQHRARKAAELRQNDTARLIPPASDALTEPTMTTPPPSSGARDRLPVQTPSYRPQRINEVPPVELSELSRDFPSITTFPEDELKYSSIPEPVSGVTLPRLPSPARVPPRAKVEEDDGVLVDDPAPLDGVLLQATTRSSTRGQEPEQRLRETEPDHRPPHRDQQARQAAPETIEPASVPGRRRRGDRSNQSPRRLSDVEFTPAETSDVAAVSAVRHEELTLGEEIRETVAIYDEPIDVTSIVEIAPGVPRMCRTCRDFRPADSGERGWCTNKWAFSHRRMVDADELPCETSIGCWWLPHDDLWLATADASAHGQPTPLVDYWLAHRVAATDGAEVEPRRRQRL